MGDSRLYSFHHGELKKLSHDHSLIGYREEIGDLTEEEAMHHPQRNVIGRDVGSQKHKANDDDFIEARVFPLFPNTTLLFCSDGLTDMITSSTITLILSQKGSLEGKASSLIKAALDAGGKDNVTVVLFEYLSDEPDIIPEEIVKEETSINAKQEKQINDENKITEKPAKRNWLKIVLMVLVGLLIGFGIAYYFGMNGSKTEHDGGEKDTMETISPLKSEIEAFDVSNNNVEALKKENEELKQNVDKLEKEIDSLQGVLKEQ